VKFYLILYNIAQFCGWSTVFIIYAMHMQGVLSGAEAATPAKGAKPPTLYEKVKYPLGLAQWGMWLEVVHALVGITRSGWFTAALQIFSRVALVTILDFQDASKANPEWCYLMLFAWGVTEMVRYSFFTLNLLNVKFYPLLWARYTFFIVLYPMGVTGELGNIYATYAKLIKYKGADPILRVTAASNSLGGYGFIVFLYALGLPFLYLHLLMMRGSQLKKAAGGSGKKVKKA
jgi:very-long-chain (3R)-3-hydroxyacyl-CoA dehydratase